ncbi:DUF5000 domain-containing lipoprotein [Compostibacter hankyongensis]|uniref:DUF4959 domain-containing protein n=1 Tax=Compostibacter hankyongensis TaxID=1007089 RepID=A0ABP8FIU4_9BACT
MTMYKYLLFLFLFPVLAGCREEDDPGIFVNDKAPDPVSGVQVRNLPGAALLTYTLPQSKDMLYVKATYSIRKGVEREAKSSYFNNGLLVEGFPDTSGYTVTLYAVSRGEKMSEPVTVTVHPLTPPVQEVFRSLELERTFGGVTVKFRNASEANVVMTVLAEDSTGEMKLADNFYTKMKQGAFAARGFDTTRRRFAVFVKDHWDNHSDTVTAELTPLFEKQLDKSKFKEVHLSQDNWEPNGQKPMSKLWDGIIPTGESHAMFSSKAGEGFPQSFTFDLGVTASLSRFTYYPRSDGSFAYSNVPRLFEIWGSNDPASDGSWESWTKLLDCEMIKPSGSPQGTVTDEDRAYSQAGINYEFPPGTPPFRYIRFKTLEVWSGSNISILELNIYGNDQ